MAAVASLREMQLWQLQGNVFTYRTTIGACEKG